MFDSNRLIYAAAARILIQATYVLKDVGWGQNKVIVWKHGLRRLCAHGAITYAGSPIIRLMVALGIVFPIFRNIIRSRMAQYARTAFECLQFAGTEVGDIQKYSLTPMMMAHYMAYQAGLSLDYNDDPNRTQQQVIDKLMSAANLAILQSR